MPRLQTFGSISLIAESGAPLAGAASQRRMLGLLAALAVAGDTGLSRDKLIGLLWPEVDEERARHSLTQALYAARRALGIADLFRATTGDVSLNAHRLTSDVRELEHALDAGELESAVALFRGPFLDGFFISGAPEFDQWLASQRERLESRVADALERLADRAEREGDRRRVLEWRRRLAALLPLDSGSAVKLMTAMAALGDRAGALNHARAHALRLREELDLAPDPAVEALAQRLREGGAPVADSQQALVLPPPSSFDVEWPESSPHAPTEVGVWLPRRPMPPLWLRWSVVALVLVGLVGVGVMLGRRTRASTSAIGPLPSRQRVVVAPFRVAGADASLAYLREGVVELLSTRLADDTAANAVDAGAVLGAWRAAGLTTRAEVTRDTVVTLATRLGAERVVIGSVVGSRTQVVLSASVLRLPHGTMSAQANVSGPADSITSLLDQLAARLLVSEAGQDESLAHHTTHSLPALKAFLAGQAAFRRNEYTAALGDYGLALRRDSSFALAALYMALSADRLNLEPALRRGLSLAWLARDDLTDADRSLLLAFVGPRYPALPTTEELTAVWQRMIDLAPGSADAWYTLGARLVKEGAAAGMQAPEAQAIPALRRALSANPDHAPARRLLARLTTDSTMVTGDTASLHAGAADQSRLSTAELREMAMASQFDAVELDASARALAILRSRASRASTRLDAAIAEHSLAVNQGRAGGALEATTRLRRIQPGTDAWLRLRVLDRLYADGDSAAAEEAARALAALTRSAPQSIPTTWDTWLSNACVVGQWRLARGDTTGVQATLSALRGSRAVSPYAPASATTEACMELLDAALAVATRRQDARARVRRLDSLVFTPQVAGDASVYAPIAIARLFERVGDSRSALRAIRKRPYMSGWPRYLAASWFEESRLAERAGDASGASTAYRRFLSFRDTTVAQPDARTEVARQRLRLILERAAKRNGNGESGAPGGWRQGLE